MKPAFLYLPDIPGDSRTAGFKGWIVLDSISVEGVFPHSSKHQTDAASLLVTKGLDRAAQKLQDAALRGTTIGDGTISIAGEIYYQFKGLYVKACSFFTGESEMIQEVDFGFEEVKFMTAAEYSGRGSATASTSNSQKTLGSIMERYDQSAKNVIQSMRG